MKINYTAHEINVYHEGQFVESIPPSGFMARIDNDDSQYIVVDGIRYCMLSPKELVIMTREDFFKKNKDSTYKPEVLPFPEQEIGTFYIVSNMVLDASDRFDLLAPNTNSPILDSEGKIIGCNGYITKDLTAFLSNYTVLFENAEQENSYPFCVLPPHVIEVMDDAFEKSEKKRHFLKPDDFDFDRG